MKVVGICPQTASNVWNDELPLYFKCKCSLLLNCHLPFASSTVLVFTVTGLGDAANSIVLWQLGITNPAFEAARLRWTAFSIVTEIENKSNSTVLCAALVSSEYSSPRRSKDLQF